LWLEIWQVEFIEDQDYMNFWRLNYQKCRAIERKILLKVDKL
jgi:hypothetical protein